jgi:lysophospholipase L1-like esterase
MQKEVFLKPKLIFFSLITILVVLFCIEVCARIVLACNKGSLIYIMYGIADIKEKQRLQKFEGNEGEADYYKSTPSDDPINPINNQGFRGREIREKKPGSIRIVCLGGSTTFGDGLDYADTYPALLQDMLDRKAGKGKFDVINGGQPGLKLSQINTLIKKEIIKLKPDIIILMNINNNFKAPNFWFVDMKGRESISDDLRDKQKPLIIFSIKNFLVRHVACARLMLDYRNKIVWNYFVGFDWKSFSASLMAPDNIWEKEFAENLDNILQILFEHNPQIQIILIEEAVNRIRYPELEAPFNKARQIMREKAKKYKKVYTLDVETAIIQADQKGEKVWQRPAFDPLHLVRRGNEIIASKLIPYIVKYSYMNLS